MSQRSTRSNKKEVKAADMLKDLSSEFQTQMSMFKSDLKQKLSGESTSAAKLNDMHKNELLELLHKFETFEKNMSTKLQELEEHINTQYSVMEQKFCSKNIILYGLSEAENENALLIDNILEICLTKLKIEDLDKKDISEVYRLGKKSSDKVRPVAIVFLRMWQRNLVFTNKSKLKGSKLFMSEMLVKTKLALYNEVREIFKNKSFTIQGRIAVHINNKLYYVDTKYDLSKLMDMCKGHE